MGGYSERPGNMRITPYPWLTPLRHPPRCHCPEMKGRLPTVVLPSGLEAYLLFRMISVHRWLSVSANNFGAPKPTKSSTDAEEYTYRML